MKPTDMTPTMKPTDMRQACQLSVAFIALVALVALVALPHLAHAESVGPGPPAFCDAPLAPLSPTGPSCPLHVALMDFAPPAFDAAVATLDGVPVAIEIVAAGLADFAVQVRVCGPDCTPEVERRSVLTERFEVVPETPVTAGLLVVTLRDGASFEFVLDDGVDCAGAGDLVAVACGPAVCEPGANCGVPDAGPGSADDANPRASNGCSAGGRARAPGPAWWVALAAAMLLARRGRPGRRAPRPRTT